MKKYFLTIFLFSTCVSAQPLPESVKLWTNRATFFWSLDMTDENAFKSKLIDYYQKIYTGNKLNKMENWIKKGNLESEYYSSYYSDLKDTRLVTLKKDSNRYIAITRQKSCYSLHYNSPTIETIVTDYKITNLTQNEVDQWRSYWNPELDGELCLVINRKITLVLNQSNLIIKEQWQTESSTLQLIPDTKQMKILRENLNNQ